MKQIMLIWRLAKNDFKAKYAASLLGVMWAFVQPMITILVFWFVFQMGFKSKPVDDVPFILWFVVAYTYGFLSDKERIRIRAQLQIAAWMGLVGSPDLESMEERRKQKNEEIKKQLAKGETVYGLTHYTQPMYLEYELTRFQLEYTVFRGKSVGLYPYPEITEKEKQDFYAENRDLFTRYFGDSFGYDEVKMIIEKRLREQEYEKIVRELSNGYTAEGAEI